LTLVAAGAWLLITGRNLPGILGRGLTQGDNLRMKRAPAIFFRALGTFVIGAGLSAFWIALFVGVTSTVELIIAAMLGFFFVGLDIAALVWLLVVADKNKLFRWDKP
jgi:predicted membrane protein